MANLSRQGLQIDILTGMPDHYRVTATVNVELSQFETFLISNGLPLQLHSTLWGEDSGSNKDDNLFSFSTQTITSPGIYTFTANVHRGVLNEDNTIFDKRDEVYNRFTMVSGTNLFPLNIGVNSPTVWGSF
jgi:hypothetical protein